MPRGPRLDAPGTAHHVMVRGIEQRVIFADDPDRERFVERLSGLVLDLGFRLFAWALMPNHAHLVLQSGSIPVSRLMARLGTGYARYFNRRHARVGHLFQNRFRSRIVADDLDLMGVVLYVHRNPLDGGLVPDADGLERFPWCGHGAVVGARPACAFEAADAVRGLFAQDPAEAIARVRARVAAAADSSAPCGDPAPPSWAAPPVPKRLGQGRDPSDLGPLISAACALYGLTEPELRTRSNARRVIAARTEIVVRAVSELGWSGRQVGRALEISDASVSRALKRGRAEGGQ